MQILLLIVSFVSLFTFFFNLIYSFEEEEPKSKKKYSITFIIPAYNEEENIVTAIDSILKQNYDGKVKIIVVDDGSTDATPHICELYAKKGLITYFRREHQGKVPNVNFALKHVDTDLFCVLDADTFLDKDAVSKLVSYFEDEKVAAVLAALRVANPRGILGRVQDIEYAFSIFMRKILSFFGGLWTTHGATIFRTKAVKEVGDFDETSLVEDMDMALRLIRAGYKIKADYKAKAYTKVPLKLKSLTKQRIRWYTGFIKTALKHRDVAFNPSNPGMMYVFPLSFFWIGISFFLVYNLFSAIGEKAFLTYLSLKAGVLPFSFSIPPFSTIIISVIGLIAFLILAHIVATKCDYKFNFFSITLYIVLFGILAAFYWVASVFNSIRGVEGWKS